MVPRQPPTVGILGEDTMVEDILEALLRDEGYATKMFDVYAPIGAGDPFAPVDVFLLSPNVDPDRLPALLNGMGSVRIPNKPILEVPTALKIAVLDDTYFTIPWRSLFGNLVQRIEAAYTLEDTG